MTARLLFLRRRFLVDAPFQFRTVLRATLVSCFLLVAVIGGILWPMVRGLDAQDDSDRAGDAARVFLHLHANMWWIVLVCVVLPTLAAIQESHRIAGPLVRVKRVLQQLRDGQLPPPLRTRRADYLKPEVELLNETVARIGEHMQRARAVHRELCDQLAAAAGDPAVQGSSDATDKLAAAAETAACLGSELLLWQAGDEEPGPAQSPPATTVLAATAE